MRSLAGLKSSNLLWLLILFFVACGVQYLLQANQVVPAILVFILTTIICLFRNTLKSESLVYEVSQSEALSSVDLILVLIIWAGTLALRMTQVDGFYSIDDLNARFMVTALEISRGDAIFPFMPPYEYDESLICWLYSPLFRWFGHSWNTVKLLSVSVNSLLIPVGYIWLRRYFNQATAILGTGFLALSGYFQHCDPMISMSRFSMVAVLVLLLPLTLEKSFTSRRYLAWMILSVIICATGMYLHSTGRVCLAIILFPGIHRLFTDEKTGKRTTLIRTTLMLAGAIILFLPFLDQVSNHSTYLQFKRRQIFGFHEAYPFSWAGLWQNIVTVFTNFHYRAVHHMHFNDSRALLRPVTAAGSLGFFWLSLTLIRKREFQNWLILVFLTTAPLVIVTPGHWRGLYFSPPVALLTLGAGLFFAVLIHSMVRSIPGITKRKRLQTAMILFLVISMLSGVLAFRYESYTSGVYSPRPTDMLTHLYDELADEPDIPHYFSMTIPEMIPGYAIFHLMGSAWFTRYGALSFDPVRHMRDASHGKRLDPGTLDADTARFVLSNRDMERLKEVKTIFHGYTLIYLPVSQLIMVEVKGECDETSMDGSGDLSSVKIRTGA